MIAISEDRGMTLIEMLIAMTVIAIAIAALVAGLTSGMLTLQRSSMSTSAAAVADQQMEAMRSVSFDAVGTGPTSATYVLGGQMLPNGPPNPAGVLIVGSIAGFASSGTLQVQGVSATCTYTNLTVIPSPRFTGIAGCSGAVSNNAIVFGTAPAPPTEPFYTGDAAYVASTAVTLANCSVTYCFRQATVKAAGGDYRIDTYVNWKCPLGGTPDVVSSPPTCTDATSSRPLKLVTIVVRNALSPASVLFRESSNFDPLG
jgi:prepilin-type N-terminal cleavage/methylation domain-containing protein